jgi:hypothetical protein
MSLHRWIEQVRLFFKELLPLMEKKVQLMLRRINVAHDALAEIVSTLDEP